MGDGRGLGFVCGGKVGGCVLGEDGGRSGKCGYEELIEWKCG